MTRLFAVLGLLAVLAFSEGCAAELPALTPPSRGGAVWHRLESEHFDMETDVESARAASELIQFESLYATLREATGSSALSQRVLIVLFARKSDFHVFGDASFGGFSMKRLPGELEGSASMVFPEGDELINDITFLHEVDHLFNHQRFFSMPSWLDEGMASYAETLEVHGDVAQIGGRHPIFRFVAPAYASTWFQGAPRGELDPSHAPRLGELLQAKPKDFRGPRANYFYAGAWRLVQMLRESHPVEWHAFLARMEHGESGTEAFKHTFGPNLDSVGREFFESLYEKDMKKSQLHVAATHPRPPAVEEMSEADVHLLWSKLEESDGPAPKVAAAELDLAYALAPDSTEVHAARALAFLRANRLDEAQKDIDATLAREPDNPRFLMLDLKLRTMKLKDPSLAAFLKETREVSEHLARRATTALEVDEVARAHFRAREPSEGRQYAEVAIRIDPLSSSCWQTYAWLLLEEHKLAEARRALDRVSTLRTDGTESDLSTDLDRLSLLLEQAEQAEKVKKNVWAEPAPQSPSP